MFADAEFTEQWFVDQRRPSGVECPQCESSDIQQRGYPQAAAYVTEFKGRHNERPRDTIAQMRSLAHGMAGKRLQYKTLIGKEAS